MSRLLLVPTWLELEMLTGAASTAAWEGWDVAVIGLGAVDAAAGTVVALSKHHATTRVLLLGLGGTLAPEEVPLGSVVAADRFRQWGLGAGAEPQIAGLSELELPASATGALPLADVEAAAPLGDLRPVEMLSVCAASASLVQARARAARFPHARVEEMEGYSVARAARLCGRQVACLRAIGNVAGDRDKRAWRAGAAMVALATMLRAPWLGEP